MKKNRIKFLMIEFLLLMLAVFFVWKIFDQNVAETRIAVILPESGDKRWDALINGMKQSAAENNVTRKRSTDRRWKENLSENRRTTISMALLYIPHPVMRPKIC